MIHYVKHTYQPTNTSCGPTAATILLSHYGKKISAEDAIKNIPVIRDEAGNDMGTAGQHIASWLVSLGYNVHLYSADFQTLDYSWRGLDKNTLVERLAEIKDTRTIPALGKEWSQIYVEGYKDYLNAGGNLHIEQYISSKLLDELLEDGPIMTTVNFNLLFGYGRTKTVGHLKTESDPMKGSLMNHFNVLIGEENDRYIISDPWQKPGKHLVAKELFVASIQAAQIECDNLIIQIKQDQ